MQKGESVISLSMAGLVVFAIFAIQQKWRSGSLKDVASSAQEFILETAGLEGEVPEIPGYEKLKTFPLGHYRAGLYRASPAPLTFASGRLVIYGHDNHPAFMLDTLEGSKTPWTKLYDFAQHQTFSFGASHPHATYTRSLTGNGELDVVIGQYSGGDHCCTTATVLELGKDAVKVLGRIEGLDGLPLEGLELRRPNRDSPWEIIVRRPAQAACGTEEDVPNVVSIYAYADGQYTDQTSRYSTLLESVLRQNLAKWTGTKTRSLKLMQAVAVDYATLGQREQARRFIETNLTQVRLELRKKGIDPNTCLADLESLLDDVTSTNP